MGFPGKYKKKYSAQHFWETGSQVSDASEFVMKGFMVLETVDATALLMNHQQSISPLVSKLTRCELSNNQGSSYSFGNLDLLYTGRRIYWSLSVKTETS